MAFARKRGRKWYVSFLGASGRWQEKASKARTKTEAERLAQDLERQAERQRHGLEALPIDDGETLGGLCSWWIDHRCPEASRAGQRYTLTAHIIDAPIGGLLVRAVTAAVLEDRFQELEKGNAERPPIGPNTINKIRTTLRTVFSRARKAGRWSGNNPAVDTEPRKVPRRVYETLNADEVARLLPRLPRSWRGFFAAAAYAGLRKGECAGLRKADVDLDVGTLTIRASYRNATTKGGHADVIPIPPPLLPHIEVGLKTPGPFLFPAPDGSMRPAHRPMARILQPALGAAGIVSEYVHVCRTCKHKGIPHEEHHQDPAPRNCDTCSRRLWVKAVVRKLRFHDLRHSTATILLRAGVDAHRVQRILRHRDVRTTTGTYGHLSVEDLQSAVSTAWTPAGRDTTKHFSEPTRAVANAEPENHPATFGQTDEGRAGDVNQRPASPRSCTLTPGAGDGDRTHDIDLGKVALYR